MKTYISFLTRGGEIPSYMTNLTLDIVHRWANLYANQYIVVRNDYTGYLHHWIDLKKPIDLAETTQIRSALSNSLPSKIQIHTESEFLQETEKGERRFLASDMQKICAKKEES